MSDISDKMSLSDALGKDVKKLEKGVPWP